MNAPHLNDIPPLSDKAKVLNALRLPQYVWRTAEGVARDSGVPYAKCLHIMIGADEQVCINHDRGTNGVYLFAARDHLIKSMTWIERLSAAFRGRLY